MDGTVKNDVVVFCMRLSIFTYFYMIVYIFVSAILLWKAKRQYLLTCKVTKYYSLALLGIISMETHQGISNSHINQKRGAGSPRVEVDSWYIIHTCGELTTACPLISGPLAMIDPHWPAARWPSRRGAMCRTLVSVNKYTGKVDHPLQTSHC